MILINPGEKLTSSVELQVTRIKDGSILEQKQPVASEIPFTIYLNDTEVATVQCSPSDLKEFTYGFLYSACLIHKASELTKCIIDHERWTAHAEVNDEPDFSILNKRFFTSGCGKGVSFAYVTEVIGRNPLETTISISTLQVSHMASWIQSCSPLSRDTGGLHTAGLSSNGDLPDLMADDIGRHNAVDKVLGARLMSENDFAQNVLVTSGRISSEIFQKAKRAGIEVIIARGAPTHQAVLRATDMNMTLIGFARGNNFTIYSHPERVDMSNCDNH